MPALKNSAIKSWTATGSSQGGPAAFDTRKDLWVSADVFGPRGNVRAAPPLSFSLVHTTYEFSRRAVNSDSHYKEQTKLGLFCLISASSEKSVDHRYAPMGDAARLVQPAKPMWDSAASAFYCGVSTGCDSTTSRKTPGCVAVLTTAQHRERR